MHANTLFKIKGINSRTTNCMRDYTQVFYEVQSMHCLLIFGWSVSSFLQIPLGNYSKIKMRERTKLTWCCKRHKCNTSIISAVTLSTLWNSFFFFFFNTHKRTQCTSWNSDLCSVLPVPAVPVSTALADQEPPGCSAAHYIHFLLLPLTLHSSHLTALPFAPFTASQCLQYCPQNLTVTSFLPSSSFLTASKPFLSFPEVFAQIFL